MSGTGVKLAQKRTRLCGAQRKEIVALIDAGKSQADIGVKFGVDPSVISKIKSKRAKYLATPDDAKSTKGAAVPELDEALYRWYKQVRAQGLPVSQQILMSKAKAMSEHAVGRLAESDPRRVRLLAFNATKGFAAAWLNRHPDVKSITFHGEAGSVSVTTADEARVLLQRELSAWQADCVYNCDETALFFRLLPNQTLGSKDERGVKKNKDRVTLLLCVNASGTDKLRPLIIGKAENPRALHHINRANLPCAYTHTGKGWQNRDSMMAWLMDWNDKLRAQNRRVLLLLDNASCHEVDARPLTHITLRHLPPNLTSHIQPLDAGIIRAFKAHYRRALVMALINGVERTGAMPPVTVKDAIDFAGAAWHCVTAETIRNCWAHAGIFVHVGPHPAVQPAASNALAAVDAVMDDLQRHLNLLFPGQALVAAEAVDIDADEPIEEQHSDAMILDEVLKLPAEQKEEVEIDEEPAPRIVPASAASAALATAIAHFEQSPIESRDMIALLFAALERVEANRINGLRQSSMREYFKT